jgi:hypothetical protein
MQQDGGYRKEEKEYKFIDVGGVYTFDCTATEDNNAVNITVTSTDDKDCALIYISKQDRLAGLTSMSYHDNCAKEGLKYPGGGSILLKFVLNLILLNKEKYHLKRILLTDNSYLSCNNCPENIKLARFRTLTRNYPWYTKYGFLPYDSDANKPSPDLLNKLKDNIKLAKSYKTDNIDIIPLLTKSNIKFDKQELQLLIKQNKYMRDFLNELSQDLPKNCCIIEYIIKEVFKPTHFTKVKVEFYDFYKKQFYLDI